MVGGVRRAGAGPGLQNQCGAQQSPRWVRFPSTSAKANRRGDRKMRRTMRNRIAQPPIRPRERDPEHHDFWPGFVASLIAVIVLFCGVRHLTNVDTVDGHTARETQLVKAFSSGGVQWSDSSIPPPPSPQADPAAAAQALEQWERQHANAAEPRWKVRVDTGATTPCPT